MHGPVLEDRPGCEGTSAGQLAERLREVEDVLPCRQPLGGILLPLASELARPGPRDGARPRSRRPCWTSRPSWRLRPPPPAGRKNARTRSWSRLDNSNSVRSVPKPAAHRMWTAKRCLRSATPEFRGPRVPGHPDGAGGQYIVRGPRDKNRTLGFLSPQDASNPRTVFTRSRRSVLLPVSGCPLSPSSPRSHPRGQPPSRAPWARPGGPWSSSASEVSMCCPHRPGTPVVHSGRAVRVPELSESSLGNSAKNKSK